MSRNLNVLELKTSNYFINYIQYNSNKELKNIEPNKIKNQDLNKMSLKKENCKNLIINVPIKAVQEYKSAKKLSPGRTEKKIQSVFSPNSKISYLKHFNNNSIYYSNHKKNNLSSIFKNSNINIEKKFTNENYDLIKKNNNAKDFTNLKKNNNNKKLIYSKIKIRKINEDCKNNSSIEDIKKMNIFENYNFLKNKNGPKKENNINKRHFTQIDEKESSLKQNNNLLNMLSSENIFSEKKGKNNEHIQTMNTPRIDKTFKNLVIKKNLFPENIKPEEYKKINKIGSGSFGKIYKVKWCKNNSKYAMKEMHFQSKDNILYLKERVKYIIDLQKATKCEGLIKIYGDYYFKNGKDYYYYEIMELAERDWEQEIKMREKYLKYYSEKELFIIMIQLIKTFSLLQKNHITHRDVKLQNILLINQKFKICDFGESRKLNQKGTIVQPVRGSELYMSPILFFGLNKKLIQVKHNTYKSDVFSLGMCILYASTLTQESLCDIREMTDMENIKNTLVKYLSKMYSNNFIDILSFMLEINEKNRPDFIQLEKFISKFGIKNLKY